MSTPHKHNDERRVEAPRSDPVEASKPELFSDADMQERETLLKKDVLLVATAGASLLNGMHFSPYFDPIAILLRPFLAGTVLATPLASLYVSSLFVSLLSLLIAGVPAALYERARGLKESTPVSIGIWLAAIVVITIPSFLAMAAR